MLSTDQAPRPSWDDALVTVLAAKQALRDAEASPEVNDATDAAILEASDDLLGPLDQLIIGMPSPSGDALATKLELFVEFDDLARGDPHYDPAGWMKAIAADARRLAPSRGETAFSRALAAYDAARAVDAEYDRDVWRPAYEAEQAGRGTIPKEVDDLDERHGAVVYAAENAFMNLPADTADQVLIKALVAWSGGRETDVYDEAIWADAARFTGRTGR